MKRYLIPMLLPLFLSAFCSCQKETQKVYGRYYAPTIFVNGQEEETMLTTVFAALDVTQNDDGTVELSVLYQGPDSHWGGRFTITSFQINLSGIFCERNNSNIVLKGKDIESELSYKYVGNREKGQGSIIRTFNIEGSLDKRNRSNSTITVSSKIFDEEISLSFSKVTKVESEAEFGIMGYPSWNAETVETRFFINNTEHTVTVEFQLGPDEFSYQAKTVIAAHEQGKIIIPEDRKEASYVFTFDDGRVSSHHNSEGTRFQYTGLPYDVIEKPYLFFNSGRICYNIQYKCTYTITPEIYDAAQ